MTNAQNLPHEGTTRPKLTRRSAGPKSLSGHVLTGTKIVRIAYLDEAGISNPAQEPYLVVAGVLIDADKGWPHIQRDLEYLAEEYGLPDICHFHAKDIFHGTGIFDRKDPEWPNERRRKLLLELASLPKSAGLPVVMGYIHWPTYALAAKTHFEKLSREVGREIKCKPSGLRMSAHVEAFVRAAKTIDLWVAKNAPTEQVMLIAENNDSARKSLKLVQAIYRDRDYRANIDFIMTKSFKSRHIIEALHFAEKHESPLMQLADVCAFVIKRHLQRRSDVREFYDAIAPQMAKNLAFEGAD